MPPLSKRVTLASPADLYRDYQTLRKCETLEKFYAEAAGDCLVARSIPHLATLPTPYHRHQEQSRYLRKVKKLKAFEDKHHPAPWRNASPMLRITFYQKALLTSGNVYSLTLDLSHALQAEVRRLGSSGWNYLRRRIDRYLVRDIPGDHRYWLVAEKSQATGYLHIHGGITASPDELELLRKILRRAGGQVEPKFIRHQLDLPVSYNGAQWPLYCAKGLHPGTPLCLGNTYTCSLAVGRDARQMYEAERQAIIDLTRSGKWPEVERMASTYLVTRFEIFYRREPDNRTSGPILVIKSTLSLRPRALSISIHASPLYGSW